jgi:hypothetical protein
MSNLDGGSFDRTIKKNANKNFSDDKSQSLSHMILGFFFEIILDID